MKIILLRPNMGNYRATDAMPPLAMAILAARAIGHEIHFFDDRIEEIPTILEADLIAISVETFTAFRSYQLADHYRNQGVTVVMGGFHPTLLPDEALQHADSVIIGDAEGAWEQLLADFSNKTLKSRYYADHSQRLDNYSLDRRIFIGKKYVPIELVQYSRGCRFRCDFCSIHQFYSGNVRARPVEEVQAELLTLKKSGFFLFVDDNLFTDKTRLEGLLMMLKPLKRRWGCQISIDVAKNKKLLDQLAASGCRFVLIGFESLNSQNLKQMGKPWNKVAGSYRDVVKSLHNRGINVYGTFVFGYDEDSADTIKQSVDFAMDCKLEIANFNPLIPTPGSALYDRLLKEERFILPNWWIDPNYAYGAPIFRPNKIDADRLNELCFDAKKTFYRYLSIASRLLDLKKNTKLLDKGVALLANIISHKEIINKQGRKLGGE